MALINHFRRDERDRTSDHTRLEAVARSLAESIRSAEVELAGLRRRIEATSIEAAFLFGNDLTSQTAGDRKAEGELVSAETRLLDAERRSTELMLHIRLLRGVEADIERARRGGGGDAGQRRRRAPPRARPALPAE